MSENKDKTVSPAPAPPGTVDAVGVPGARWYIAVVNHRSEKSVSERLARLGVEHYLPVLGEVHEWRGGKRVHVDRVMIPARIFIRCTERRRRELVSLPYIFRFMTNISGTRTPHGQRPLAVVPDHEISRLKFMLGVPDSGVTFTGRFVKGDAVRVVRGPFRGLEGEILQDAGCGTSRLYINIDFLGSASVEIDPRDVEPANECHHSRHTFP